MISFVCDVCGDGSVNFSEALTFESYRSPLVFVVEDLPNIRDGTLSDVLVFKCNSCESEFRYTYRELEKRLRRELSRRYIEMCLGQGHKSPHLTLYKDRIMIYCGKCWGFDGKGACPLYVYEDCKIKRLPVCDQIL